MQGGREVLYLNSMPKNRTFPCTLKNEPRNIFGLQSSNEVFLHTGNYYSFIELKLKISTKIKIWKISTTKYIKPTKS